MTFTFLENNAMLIVALIPVVGAIVRFAYATVRNYQISQRFINDIGTNHLQHIYHTLGQIAGKLEIELEEPPPIRFVDFEGRRGSNKDMS